MAGMAYEVTQPLKLGDWLLWLYPTKEDPLSPPVGGGVAKDRATGLSDDPDWNFHTASKLHSEWGDMNPEFAADSAFGPEGLQTR